MHTLYIEIVMVATKAALFSQCQRFFLICGFLICFFCSPAHIFCSSTHQSGTRRLVRVGWYEAPGMEDGHSADALGGYNYEYLVKIAQYEDWDYEFVFGDWPVLEKDLIAGRIDIIGDVAKTPERLKKYSFCDFPNGSSRLLMICRADDSRFAYNDYANFNGITVASVSSTFQRSLFEREAGRHNFKMQYCEYPRESAVFEALKTGRADVAICSDVTRFSGFKIISELEPNPYFFIVNKNKPELLAGLNDGMMQIQSIDPFMQERLFRKYFGSNDAANPTAFTRSEIEYIISKRSVRVLLVPNEKPISYREKGAAAGIIPSYFGLLTRRTGLFFEFVFCDGYADMLRRFSNGEAEICAQLPDSFAHGQSLSANLVQPYINLNYGLVCYAADIRFVKKVAVCEGCLWLADKLKSYGMEAVCYPTDTAALDAVVKRKVDGAAIFGSVYDQLSYHEKYSGLYMHSDAGQGINLCIGVSKSCDKRLYTILENAVGTMPPSAVNNTIVANTIVKQDLTPADYIARHTGAIVTETALVIFLLLLIAYLIREKRYRVELQKANNDTLKANKAMSSFLSNISHDMRTPLNGIIGFTDLAIADPLPEKKQEYLEKIRLSGALLLSLVNDTLELSRIESGKLQFKPEPVDAGELFEDIAVPIRQNAAEKGISIECSLPARNSSILVVDRNKFQEVLLNLLSNAVKYTLSGGSIHFSAGPLDPPLRGCNYRVVVADTGIGISPEFIPKLFEPFSQERAPEARDIEGTGLGLSIVKRIVDLMGGLIEVQSEKGRGSTFTVSVPIEQRPAGAAEAHKAHAAALSPANAGAGAAAYPEKPAPRPRVAETEPSSSRVQGRGRRVLLCDDNAMNLEIASLMLKSHGFEVSTASDGAESLTLFSASRSGEISLVITDLRMPKMNGWEFAAALRSLPRADAASVPIIALTADAFQENIQRSYSAGINAYVIKPLSAQNLFAEIGRLLPP